MQEEWPALHFQRPGLIEPERLRNVLRQGGIIRNFIVADQP